MATITSLAARLLLQDVTFTKTLQKAEKQTEKFAKSVTKVSSGIGNLASITTNINGIASATTGANSAVATLTSSISTSASVMMAATNVAVGLRAAFTAMTAAILMNPLTAALGAVAVAFGVVMALIARSGEQSEEELDRARKAAQEAEELNTRLGGINKRVAQIGMSSDEKEVDDMAKRLRVEVEAGRMRSETAHRWIFLLKHAQAEEKRLAEESQKQIAIQKTIADAVKEREQAGMGAVERQVDNARRSGMDPQQLRFLEITLTATESRNAALEKSRELNQQIADFEAQANQAWMTDQQKKIAKLKELGATEAQIAAARRNMEKAAEPQKRQKELAEQIAEGRKVMQGLEQQAGAIDSARGSGLAANPQAQLKGTAQAALAESARKNPVEQLTDIQKKQLEEIKKQKALQERQLAAMEKEQETVAQF